MIYVLDTDTFSDATRRRRGLRERIERERQSHAVVTSIITRLEMFKGWHESVSKAANADEIRRALEGLRTSEEFLAEFVVLPVY